MHGAEASEFRVIVSTGTLPDDFIPKILWPKHRIHQHLQVVARCRIAMQMDRARYLEHALQLDQTRSHHGEIGHHVGLAEEGAEGAHGVGDASAAFDDFFVGKFGVGVPLPGVFEAVICEAERVPSRSAKRTL